MLLGFALTLAGILAGFGGLMWHRLGRVLRYFEVDVGGHHGFRVALYGFLSLLAGLAIIMNMPGRPAARPRPVPASLPPPPEPTTEE